MLKIIELILELIIFFSLLILFWTFAGYPVFLMLGSPLLKKRHCIDERYLSKVTMMIMTYNEEKAIAKKLDNSFLIDYPQDKLEIFVVDSASTDRTQEIVNRKIKEFYKSNPDDKRIIKLVAQPKREGKASGINYGKKLANGEIIIITDGNAMMSANAIRKMIRHFADKRVGGVCGRFEARDMHNTSVGKGGSMYWQIERMLRKGESNLDSCIHMSGEITAFRKDIITELDTSMLSEDFDMAVSIRRKGLRIIYEPAAIAYEPAPTNIEDLKTQKKRIVIGTLQVLAKHKDMLLNPKYGWYGFMILPSHKLFQLLTPFLIALAVIATTILAFVEHAMLMDLLFLLKVISAIALVGSILLTMLAIFKNDKILCFIKYFAANNWIIILGWLDFIRGKKIVTWKKIESSREF